LNEINSNQNTNTNDNKQVIQGGSQKRIPNWVVIFFLFIGVIIIFYSRTIQSTPTSGIGNPRAAFDLTLRDLQNNPVSIRQYIGKSVILVNNFATWCPPCEAEMPELESYYTKYKMKGFLLIAIASGEEINDVEKFTQKYKLSFPVWSDPETKAFSLFKGRGLPYSIVIDKKGNIRQTWTGGIDQQFLEKNVTPIINEE